MQFQLLLQELTCSSRTITALLDGITPEEARIKPDENSWSILEVTCHLLDEEKEDFRERLGFILHHQKGSSLRPIDPQGWVSGRKYNQQDFEKSRTELTAERVRSLEWLQGLAEADWSTSFNTGQFEVSAGDMLASWVAHDNLHIRQLVELRRQYILKISIPFQVDYAGEW